LPFPLPRVGLCWASLMHASLAELIDVAGASGFASLTVAPSLYFKAREGGITDAELRRRISDSGITITSIDPLIRGLPGIPPMDNIAPELRGFFVCGEEECYQAAEALDASDVNIAHFLGHSVDFQIMAEALDGMCERAQRRGFLTTLEFMPDTGMPDLHTASALLSTLGSHRARLVVDMWHVARSGTSSQMIESLPAGSIRSVQLCDRRTPPAPQAYLPMTGRDLPGEGDLPLAALLSAALNNSPSARIELEIVNNSRLTGMWPHDAGKEIAAATTRWAATASPV
jgi:sugar phosphate isomerase/epimerase